jgi:2-methylisocitrate lyase-like PEP mutase family enzyme
MADQVEQARHFRSLHVPSRPIILFNVWDAGSAKAVTAAGAKALATGSASVAAAHGFADAEEIPLDLVLANAARIVQATELPVSLDFERGYGDDASAVGESAAAVIATGIIGCNIEDSFDASHQPRPIDEAAARIAAVRAAADRAGISFFINARTDIFFLKPGDQHDEAMADEALARADAYAAAGADGLFVPLLASEPLIARVTEASPLPVNVMMWDNVPPLARLAELGVARVSYGPGPYRRAMAGLEQDARAAFESING